MLTFLPFCFFTFKNFIIFAPKITNNVIELWTIIRRTVTNSKREESADNTLLILWPEIFLWRISNNEDLLEHPRRAEPTPRVAA